VREYEDGLPGLAIMSLMFGNAAHAAALAPPPFSIIRAGHVLVTPGKPVQQQTTGRVSERNGDLDERARRLRDARGHRRKNSYGSAVVACCRVLTLPHTIQDGFE
jgi:hypothetical protein